MRLTSVIVLLLLFAGVGTAQRNVPPTLDRNDIWIQDVTVVSPERATPLQHAHVVVRDGRILWVSTDAPRPDGNGQPPIAGTGKFLVPGLIDGHVHLAEVPGMIPDADGTMKEISQVYFEQLPRSYLYFGFTAVVDLNVVDRGPLDRIRAAAEAPAVFDCGNALALANGYPMVFMPPALRFERYPNFLYDPAQRADIPAKYAPEEHTPEAAVQRVAAGGGRCVKVHYEPGFGPFAGKLPVPTRELLRSAREASHKRGLPLLLHANSIAAHRFAVDVQPDAVVHGMWNWGANDDAPALPADVVQVLDAEREHGIGMMPTSRVIGGLADLFRSDFLEDPQVARVLPHQLVSWYRSREGQWFARETAEGFRGAPAERARNILREVQARGQRAAVHFANGGGRILFGSDTPSAPTYANPPGYNGYLELRELESSGISPRQLLAASTIENARLFHLEKDYGTVEPGKIASLLLLNADPLRSTAAFDAIDTVVVRGRVISRSTLSAR